MDTKKDKNIFLSGITYLITLIIMVPFLWMILLSFKDSSAILTDTLSLPKSLDLSNFNRAFEILDF